MAGVNSNDCLVGCSLSGDRIRIAVIASADSGTGRADSRRLRCDEIVIPDVEAYSLGGLPPASTLVPLFKATLTRLGVRGGRAAVAVQGPHMVLRYFVGSDDQVRTALHDATERSLGYVQLGLGDRVVDEHLHPIADSRVHGLLAVSTANTIDLLTSTLRQVELRVMVIEPALVALTRIGSITGKLSDSKVSFVLLVDSDGIEIGVVLDGHVLFSRRPPLTACLRPDAQGLESGGADRPSSIGRELERMSRHYMRAFGVSDEVRHVNICGPEDLVRPYVSALENSQDFQADILRIDDTASTALSITSDDLTGKEAHAVALGAAAALVTECSDVVGPNLTSESEVRRRPPWEALFRAICWPTVVALGIWGVAYLAQGHLDDKVARLRFEVDYPSSVEAKHRELRMQLAQAEQRALQLNELVQKLPERSWRELAETVRICVPARLWLTHVRLAGEGQLSIEGAAYDEALIQQFTKNLEDSPIFESVTLITQSSSRHDNTIVTEFSVECTIISDLPGTDASSS